MLQKISRRLLLGRLLFSGVSAGAMLGPASTEPVISQEKEKDTGDGDVQVWVYRDMPEEGKVDKRSKTEAYFTPYLFMPESDTANISADPKFPIDEIAPNETGTCIEMYFKLAGAGDYLAVAFQPGARLGDKPPLDIVKEGLVVGSGRPVFLKFRARTVAGKQAKVRFESCGFKSGRIRDGVKSVHTPEQNVTVLTENWRTISIDLTDESAGLTSLACPLKAIVRTNENSGVRDLTIYIDDVRFEVTRPVSK